MTGLPLITCPACLAEYGLEAALGQDDARGVLRELARCPLDAAGRKALLRYVAMFAPARQRLRWSRVEALLGELNGWIEAGRIERHGRLWATPPAAWRTAVETLEAKPDLRRPLKGHGLLLEILAGQSDRMEGDAERRAEDRKRGTSGTGGGERQARRAGMPASIRQALQQYTQPQPEETRNGMD
jgi:hypothetical protein